MEQKSTEQKPMEFKKGEPENKQLINRVMNSTIKPIDFQIGQNVKAKNLPGEWIVLQILRNHKYIIGSKGTTREADAKDLTLI